MPRGRRSAVSRTSRSPCSNLDASLDFYARYRGHARGASAGGPGGNPVAWISDLTRPFVLVLIETTARRRARTSASEARSVTSASRSRHATRSTPVRTRASRGALGVRTARRRTARRLLGLRRRPRRPQPRDLATARKSAFTVERTRRTSGAHFHFHSGSRFSRKACARFGRRPRSRAAARCSPARCGTPP